MYIEGLLKPRHELGEALLADCIIEKKNKIKRKKEELKKDSGPGRKVRTI